MYIKYYLVDTVTGLVLDPTAAAANGRTHPDLPGLDVKFWIDGSEMVVSFCNDGTDITGTGIVELSVDEFNSLKAAHDAFIAATNLNGTNA